MKKNQIQLSLVIAGLAASSSVWADDAPPAFKFYGVAGLGVVSGNGFGTSAKSFSGLADQLHTSGQFGFLGSTDLEDGVFIKYNLEASLSLRSGAAGKDAGGTAIDATNGPLFDREANIALKDEAHGQLKLGRGKTFGYEVLQDFDSRGNWNLGGLKPIARYAGFYGGTNVTRFDSFLRYTSPKIEGFNLDFAHRFGNALGDLSAQNADNLGVKYINGPFEAAYSHTVSKNVSGNDSASSVIDLVAAKYQVSPAVTLFGGTASTRNDTTANGGTNASGSVLFGKDATGKVDNKPTAGTYWLGAVYKHSPKWSYNFASYGVTDKVNADGKDSLTMNSIGAIYNLGKGTDITIDFVRSNRASNAASNFTIFDRWVPDGGTGTAVSESTKSQNAVAIGVQYKF